MTSKLGDRDRRHDRFYQRAKKDSFAARSVYKLEEIDRKFHLFHPGNRVLDLGCRPGSWLQYAAGKVGEKGALVGLDRTPIEVAIPSPGARILVGDVHQITAETLRGELPNFDVVLSDMAPDTTGVRSVDQARSEALFERALDLALLTLGPGGRFVGKLFQGPEWKQLIERTRSRFSTVKTFKPESSRAESIEQYVVAIALRPEK